MIFNLTHFASETAHNESGGLFDALGIDLKMLIFQIIGFCVLVYLLAKFVFPIFNKVIDAREKAFKAGAEAAAKAKADAEATEKRIGEELERAKKQAAETIDLAHKEAAALVSAAEEKAGKKAAHIVEAAESRLQQDVQAARGKLKAEMQNLLADAASVVLKRKITSDDDKKLINEALSQGGAEEE